MYREYESVTERELREFIENYPRELTKHTVNLCTPPLVQYIDFEMGDAFTGIVAKEYFWTDKKGDLWYVPENERYYILRDCEETLQKVKKMKEEAEERARKAKRYFYANALLKDGKLLFWKTGKFRPYIYSFFDDFWDAGLNYAQEMEWEYRLVSERGRYKVVNMEVDKIEDAKEFYRQYELHEDFKGEKPY